MERKNGHRPISAGLLLVGIVLTVIGLFGSLLGSPVEEVISLSGNFTQQTPGINEEQSGLSESFSQELPNLSEITLETAIGNIEVVEGDRSYISGSGYKAGTVTIRYENGRLVVRQTESEKIVADHLRRLLRKGVRDVFQSGRLVITVAKGTQLKSVEISHGAGNITLEGLEAKEVEIETGAGEVQVDDAVFDEVYFMSGAGNISLVNVGIWRNFKAECGAGNILLKGSLNGNAKLSCGAGNITADLDGKPEDFRIEADAGLGQVKVNETSYGREANIKPQRAVYEIEAEAGTGSVEINIG